MTGNDYTALICRYVLFHFERRGIRVYREVPLGKSIIGKDRRVDILIVDDATQRGLAVECKYQESQGTTEEKIPYSLDDLRAMRMPGVLVYAGNGWSNGVLHMLRASDMAAHCFPDPPSLKRSSDTLELDHVLAVQFQWWDLLVDERKRVRTLELAK